MAKRDDIEKFISSPDGVSKGLNDYSKKVYDNDKSKFISENSASSKKIRENVYVEETQRVEKMAQPKTPRANSSRSDAVNSIIRKPDLTFSVSSAVAAIGSTAAAVAVTVAVAVVIVIAALSVTVSLESATAYSLSFYVDITNEENKTFTATLSQGDMSIAYDLVQSDYLTFSDLIPDSEYNLRIIEKESGDEYYNNNFCTLKNDIDRVSINASFTADSILTFSLSVSDLRRDEFYTVEVTDSSGKKYLVKDDTVTPQAFEIQLDNVEDAYIKISINGKYALLEKVSKLHTFGEPVFDWTATNDGYTAKAVFIDVLDSTYKKEVDATVTSETAPATCENDGKIVYTATVLFDGNNYEDNNTVILSALGHDYSEPEWNWSQNITGGYSVVATFTCSRDANHIENIDAVVTSQAFDATCEDSAKTVYTATITFNGQTHEDTKTDTYGDPLGHEYGEPEWEWVEDAEGSADGDDDGIPNYKAYAIFTCVHDSSHTLRLEAEVNHEGGLASCEEPGQIIYYASVVFEEEDYQDEKEVTLPATGHAYGAPAWNWQEDGAGGYSVVTATFTCANDPEHVQVLEANVTEQYTAPTCDNAGIMDYTATVTFDGHEYTDTRQAESGQALGHDYGEPEWEWTETNDGWTAEAVFTCSRDGHVMRLPGGDYAQEGGVDCESPSTIVYYARVTYDNVEYEGTKEVNVPAAGHSYVPVFNWIQISDQYQAEFYYVCEREDSHFGPITAQVTSTQGDGYTLYTATATYENVEYTDTKKVVDENSNKNLAVGVNYFIGDTIEMGNNTVYFYDDYEGGAHRTNMSGSTPVVKVLLAGDDGGASLNYTDILDYDRVLLDNVMYARMEDGEYGGYHGSSEETSWRFTAGQGNIVGVTIVSGTGTDEDPYVLAPVYGVTVTYDANGGLFNSTEASTMNKYYAGNSNYVTPPAEDPTTGGMVFVGWYTDEFRQNKFDFETTPITEDITLYAGWIAIE